MNISQAYRADVTSLVAARRNGTYALSGFSKPMHTRIAPININGASLIVFFDDGNPLNNRDVVLFEGNDSNAANSYDAPGWNVALKGIKYSAGKALLQMHVSDGQLFAPPHDDDSLMLNGQVLAPGPNVFCGNSVPSSNMGPTGNGCLWDIKTFDISSFLHRGTNAFSLSFGSLDGDCVSLIVAAINLPAGAAPPPTNTPPTITCPRPLITESLDAVVLQAHVRDIDGNALGYTISIDGTELESGSIPASARPTLGVISFSNTLSLD